MKILAITNLFPPHYIGGYELRCGVAVRTLRERGHQVEVLTSNHRVNGTPDDPHETGVSRTLRIHGFFGHPWLGIRQLRHLELHNNRLVREAIERVRPDVVHVWNLGGLSKSICHTLQRLGIPVVFDVCDHWIARSLVADVWLDWWNRPEPSLSTRVLRTFWSLTGARARWDRIAPTAPVEDIQFPRIAFCSQALRDLTAAKGFQVTHGAVIHCAADTGRFCGEPIPASRPLRRLLYVGRLSEDKGVMTALRAMSKVSGLFPGELRIYGRGEPEYTARLEAFVKAHRLPVTFHTARPDEMPAVYREHDALLFTSEWEEPFAHTPLEAMASGLPVIGTTTGGSKELFRHGINALTYDAGDADQLARRILELSTNPIQRANIAATGHAEVRSRLCETAIVDQIENYLLSCIASAGWHGSSLTQDCDRRHGANIHCKA